MHFSPSKATGISQTVCVVCVYSQQRVENWTPPSVCPFDWSILLLSRGPRRSHIQGRSGSLASAWSKRWERPNLVGKGRYKFPSLAWFAAPRRWWTPVVETKSRKSIQSTRRRLSQTRGKNKQLGGISASLVHLIYTQICNALRLTVN